MQAIETRYKGYRFRSRLEARWAVYFDTLGIEWEYEPEGFILDDGTMYLPDFYIKSWGCYAEVKPKQFTEQEFNKCKQLNQKCLLLDTSSPESLRPYYLCVPKDGPQMFSCYMKHEEPYYPIDGKDWRYVMLGWSAAKGRLWFLLGESINSYVGTDEYAATAAKSARFEYGETPGG